MIWDKNCFTSQIVYKMAVWILFGQTEGYVMSLKSTGTVYFTPSGFFLCSILHILIEGTVCRRVSHRDDVAFLDIVRKLKQGFITITTLIPGAPTGVCMIKVKDIFVSISECYIIYGQYEINNIHFYLRNSSFKKQIKPFFPEIKYFPFEIFSSIYFTFFYNIFVNLSTSLHCTCKRFASVYAYLSARAHT